PTFLALNSPHSHIRHAQFLTQAGWFDTQLLAILPHHLPGIWIALITHLEWPVLTKPPRVPVIQHLDSLHLLAQAPIQDQEPSQDNVQVCIPMPKGRTRSHKSRAASSQAGTPCTIAQIPHRPLPPSASKMV